MTMKTYLVKGYNGPMCDFTATIGTQLDLRDGSRNHMQDHKLYHAIKDQLLDSDCPSDYLDVFDLCDFECREDLANNDKQAVWIAESYGCDNCQNRFGEGDGDNEHTDGCDDSPHGAFMLTFDEVAS